jgi:uncharacterized protein DUF4382
MRTSRYWALTLAAGLAACDGGAGPQMSHVFVRLTDTPAGISAASAWVSTVYLIGGDGTSRDTITTGPSTEYDLLALQGGVTALLGDQTIPAGDYEQLRLVVDSAMVLLDGETDVRILKVPSGMQTGIKVEFGGPVHIQPGRTDLTVDFDVAQSFVITGPTPPRQVLFKPVLHGVVTDVSGSISGTSSPAAALGRVFAINGTDTVATADADPTTGAYTISFLPAATYTVLDSSTASGHKAPTQSVVVAASQHVTGVDFTIP